MFSHRSVATAALLLLSTNVTLADSSGESLRAPKAFDSVRNRTERSVALFTEAGKVLQHPRCLNCHPVERQPTQGDDLHPHMPPVHGGPENRGTKELPCTSCHGPHNTATLGTGLKSIPGSDPWALAPASMAWQGFSLGEICAQLKDPARNGNRTLAQIEEHLAKDHLVGWAWHPGEGRTPAPGTQQIFGELIAAWIKTGAHCPKP
ncbi:Isoquinoline 1-oxidoreductase subunit [Steroidobacter sp. S1-65]|uniref:Isoquinoline 1-oxidoreductase subunit n=1 Tax=Steroidobacter gossypii TaxID=2805490 RepID=A0ABS1WQK9_9GAMM|nr:Isoquinoline 1-oxidoreductase subunit [Steroidobacter gossypii]MBM0103261.1 Isoquinoline 1-oxidoreductase subunit [Steroidobacter gossypii]